jgi:hypothetical protein
MRNQFGLTGGSNDNRRACLVGEYYALVLPERSAIKNEGKGGIKCCLVIM